MEDAHRRLLHGRRNPQTCLGQVRQEAESGGPELNSGRQSRDTAVRSRVTPSGPCARPSDPSHWCGRAVPLGGRLRPGRCGCWLKERRYRRAKVSVLPLECGFSRGLQTEVGILLSVMPWLSSGTAVGVFSWHMPAWQREATLTTLGLLRGRPMAVATAHEFSRESEGA